MAYSATFNLNPNLGTARRGRLLRAGVSNRRMYAYSDTYRFAHANGDSDSYAYAHLDPYGYSYILRPQQQQQQQLQQQQRLQLQRLQQLLLLLAPLDSYAHRVHQHQQLRPLQGRHRRQDVS